ncbi:energy transducer TonB [Mucilaginibacter sp. FT3.2]|uniref:energy transducer TonB n=1 Tax=Mucilaginibacter sp. FT3.2 TaxID=2723090 RepID=UPI00161E69A8|nr:energy transducer TonB [Mucilaginibacter sp. FT3.2]MBB6233890.1 protein TonB [Mucilaginibacter sp. FT3.2]
MPITKFDLYNGEWLDLVFDHRNKEYGAYELRQTYGKTMSKAMGLTFAGLAVLITASIVFRPAPVPILKFTPVTLSPQVVAIPVKAELKKTQPPKSEPIKPTTPVKTIQSLPPVVVPNDPPVEPHKTTELMAGTIGSTDSKGTDKSGNVLEDKGPGGGGSGAAVDNTIHDVGMGGLEVMPEPVGGSAAWSKFLQKNLRFPGVAQEQGLSGRVMMSFVIEKDGSLSNIKVERGAGFGFDEEAMRVLKLAKAWKPGMQNGQPVRVKYVIPMNFQLAEQ